MQANENDLDLATNDLGPLAWVLDELRKSLESASAALRRFVRDAGLARGQDMASVDTGQLRIARQQLHQAVGALEMVGLGAPALILRAMEASVQKFVERPELCSEPAASKVERAGFALTEYLEGVLLGKVTSPVALFPQYKDVQELAGSDRIHPADLWPYDWRWIEPETPAVASKLVYDPAVRSRMDQAVLRIVKSGDAAAARDLAECCLGLAAGQEARQPRTFWKICAGYFEAMALGLVPADVYVKRAGSRVLLQYATLSKGDSNISDRLAQDLLFFCAQAVPPRPVDAPALASVREAYGLQRFAPVDYATAQFGRFDPVLLTQARKRIGVAKESWSAASGGDVTKFKNVGDQFHAIGDSLTKLHAPSAPLAQSLMATVDGVVRSGQPPRAEVAMEVATAVLYLEAAFQDLDPADSQLAVRTARLAERLDRVRQGGQAEALEPWMEELYRRVSDRQTMGSVVGELRGTLSELEKLLDAFFRDPENKEPLKNAPTHLLQMRGVLSVLGLDKATLAVARMRDTVEQVLIGDFDQDPEHRASTFDKLGNNLGALGFLIDMLNYQPALAKKLFVFDEVQGELRPLMGRLESDKPAAAPAQAPVAVEPVIAAPVVPVAAQAVVVEAAPVAAAPVPAPPVVEAPAAENEEDDELLQIFLEEAREVVGNGLAALEALAAQPSDVAELTTLRRAFHTLKGSSRMVGLNEFGEAGWALEQVLNTWLADQKPATDDLRTVSADALRGFGRWVEDIAAGTDAGWKSGMFRGPADTLRTEGRVVAFQFPGATLAPVVETEAPALEIDFSAAVAELELPPAEPLTVEPAPELPTVDVPSFEFDLTPAAPAPVAEPAAAAATDLLADFDLGISIEAAPLPSDSESFGATHVIRGQAVVAEEITLDELPADFAIELDSVPKAPVEAAPAPVPEPEIVSIDFDSLNALSESPVEEPITAQPSIDDQTKVIGGLRIGIPLYNVYLNEADEWSRRLSQELAEWALELKEPISDTAVGLAHALAGSSATVGFHALSDIARALEGSLQHAQRLAWGTPQHGKAFVEAAEEIRRLLHQFAAGFLKESDPRVAESLAALELLKLPLRPELRDSGYEGMDISELVEEAAPVKPAVQPATQFVQYSAPAEAAPASHQGNRLSGDDDIDAVDAIDPDLFPIFEEEAVDLMPKLGAGLRQWAQQGRPEGRDEVLRVLHTLKGSARLAGALRLGEMAHRMESAIEGLPAETPAADLEPLLQRFDDLQTAFDALRTRADQPEAEVPAAVAQPQAQAPAAAAPTITEPQPQQPAAQQPAPTRALLAAPVTTLPLVPQRAVANQAVRVRSQLLDRLMNQAGEVMITRSRLENELRNLCLLYTSPSPRD